MQFCETSAKTNINIYEIFMQLTEKVIEKNPNLGESNIGNKLDNRK